MKRKRLPQRARDSIVRGSSIYYRGHRFRTVGSGVQCKYCGVTGRNRFAVGPTRCPERPSRKRKQVVT